MSKDPKNKIALYVLLLNTMIMLGLYYKYILYTSLSKAMSTIISIYPLGVTDSPSAHNLISEAFQINIIIVLLYFLVLGIMCYLIIWWENHSRVVNGISLSVLLGILAIAFAINNLFVLILLLPLLISLCTILIMKRYFEGKKVLILSIVLIVLVAFAFALKNLINYESFGSFTIDTNELLNITILNFDKFSIQSTANFTLIVTILTELQYLLLIPILGLCIWILLSIYNKFERLTKKPTFKGSIFTGFKLILVGNISLKIILIVYTATIGTMHIQINDRYLENYPEIKDGYCFTDNYKEYEMGNLLVDENIYFDNCYETVNGTLRVYREIADNERSIFDLVNKDFIYERIFIVDEDGNELLSIDLENTEANIFATTSLESNEGYDNTITVLYKGEEAHENRYSIYDLEGNLILELPAGLPSAVQGKTDSFYPYGMKLLTKDEKVIHIIEDDLGEREEYEYYFDGRIIDLNK